MPGRGAARAAGALALLLAATAAAETWDPALRAELLDLEERDQRFRLPGHRDPERQAGLDAANLARLKEIVDRHGWPSHSRVGVDGAEAAWIVVQHADSDPAFQARALALIGDLVGRGEASPSVYAYLYDHLHYPQRYGTQGDCTPQGGWRPRAIEDPQAVDRVRAAVGLDPLADYAARVASVLCTPATDDSGR